MIKKTLYKFFVPSWTATITKAPPTNPFADTLTPTRANTVENKISVERFCHQILANNLSSRDLRIIVKTNIRWANFSIAAFGFFLLCGLLILLNWMLDPNFNLLGISAHYLLFIDLTCLIQMLRLIVDHLHKAKQIVVGCLFPKYWMVTYPRNITHLYDGVFIKKKLVHKAFPFIDHTLDMLKETERKSARINDE